MEKMNNNLQNIKSNSFKNNIKNNFKTLKNHIDTIYHLFKLNDGRIISCGYDCLLNLYKKDSYELQLSIKEHLNRLISFN